MKNILEIYNKPGDEGSVYTLRYEDGSEREIGEAQKEYHVLADIIDRAFENKLNQ